jgi:hypothetical protein
MKKYAFLAIVIFVLASCSNNSDELVVNTNDVITGYKITTYSNYDDPSIDVYKTVENGNLVNGKLFSTTYEQFINEVSAGNPSTVQQYFYTNDLLTQIHVSPNYHDEYFYDNQNRFIGAKRIYVNGNILNYRFIHQNENVVYCERINLAYDDPSAVASNRMILTFDQDDNVVSAGYDTDFDGLITNLYSYTYENDNLGSMQKPDGSIVTYDYSTVIDNFGFLREASYGKKVLRMICSENFCGGQAINLHYSKNLIPQDLIEENYEVLPNNFYSKKTKTESQANPNGQHITETEFYFN